MSDSPSSNSFHVVLCTGNDIKGLLASNMADQFFTPKNMKLSIFLCHDAPKTEGAKLASEFFGPHEYRHWFGSATDDEGKQENLGYIGELDEYKEHRFEERNVGEDQAFSTFQELRDRGISVTVLEKKINNSKYLEILRSIKPDVIYSARFQQIFKAPILQIPTHGVLNMHPGALPAYKGLHVDMRAMMHELDKCTMTMHEVDTGIDTGKFLNDFEVKIDPDISLFWHRVQLQVGGMNMFFKAAMRMAGEGDSEEKNVSEEKNEELEQKDFDVKQKDINGGEGENDGGQYFTWPDREEYERFAEMGLKHVEDSDLDFIKGLFDKRISVPTTLKQTNDGAFVIQKSSRECDHKVAAS